MASIKGIALKAVKTGIGHDFGGFQANIYLHNKKIGHVLDDGWGGDLQLDFDKQEEEFDQLAEAYRTETNETLLSATDHLIYSLMDLIEAEKAYKKSVKQGYNIYLYLDYRPKEQGDVPVPKTKEESYQCATVEFAEKLIKEKKPVAYEIYSSLNDFVIA